MPNSYNVMIVDDEESMAFVVKRVFRTLPDFQISIVKTLAHARTELVSKSFDLIIADYLLPDGKGTELLSEIPQIPVPIVLMTGYADEKILDEALRLGAVDVIRKHEETFQDIPRISKRAIEFSRMKKHFDLMRNRCMSLILKIEKSKEKTALLEEIHRELKSLKCHPDSESGK